jgi:hypothetical protein
MNNKQLTMAGMLPQDTSRMMPLHALNMNNK